MNTLTSGHQIGSYELLDLISRTNMGEVWRARNATGQIVALKTISTEADPDPVLLTRSQHEGAAHQTLHHPFIVPILDFFDLDDKVYLVMEYIAGGSLADRLDQLNGEPMPSAEAVSISRQVLTALDYAHQHGVIHRDVKPSNILLDGERALLTDFGIALTLGRQRLTAVSQVLGTEYYMSPEQICTPLEVNHLTDVYSFGCVLYEMLAGRPPFQNDGSLKNVEYQVLSKHVHEEPPPLTQWNPDVPPRLERMVLTALSKKPEDRFPGCGSFERALASVEEDWKQPPTETPLDIETLPDKKEIPPPAPTPRVPLAPVRRVHAVANVLGILAAALSPLSLFEHPDYLAAAFTLGFLAVNILLLRLLYKAWRAIQDGDTRTTAGRAVGFMLIPVYSLYWAYRALPGYARQHNAFVARHQLAAPPQRLWFYIVFCATHYTLPVVAWATGYLRIAGLPILFDYWVLTPIMAGVLAGTVNRLAKSINMNTAQTMAAAPGQVR